MSTMPRSKDRSRGELEKLRGMNTREKLEYAWSYYSYYIIGAAVAIVFIVSLLTTCFGGPDIGLSIEWSGSYIEQEEFDKITAELDKRMFSEEANTIVQGALVLTMTGDPVYDMSQRERLMAVIAAGAVDIFITDSSTLREYSMMEYILPLDFLIADVEALNPDAYYKITDEAVYMRYGLENTAAERFTGIRITDSPLFSELSTGLYDDAYLCVAITVKNYDNAVRAITEFFN